MSFSMEAPPPAQPQVDEETWTTKDGRKILVADMDEQHVRNALRLCIRKFRQLNISGEVEPQGGLDDGDWDDRIRYGSGD